jgi:hypothetical protein
VADLQTKHAPVAGVHLPGLFWLAVLVTGALFVGMIFVLPGLGVPATIALVAATIRVPLLQVRLSRQAPERPLPKPLLLLISSWALMLAAGFASCVAFCAICIPTGFAIFATNMDGNDAGFLLFGLSGLVGIGAFLLLFVWSLRLPA